MYRKLSSIILIFLCLLAVTCIFMELPARPATAITDNSTSLSSESTPTSTTIFLGGPANEAEEPLSWWLITIIVVGGLLIILVTWRLVHKAGGTSTK
jgi:H+/Cl- antiporter ClcA